MATPRVRRSEGADAEFSGLQLDDGLRQAAGRTYSRQRDRSGSIHCRHCPDRNNHCGGRNQSHGKQPTPTAVARNLWKHRSVLLFRGDHCVTTGVRHGAAIHLPNLHRWSGMGPAGGTAATQDRTGCGLGLDWCGAGDPTAVDRPWDSRAGTDPRASGSRRRSLHSPGLRLRSQAVGQRASAGDHSLFPIGLDPHLPSCCDATGRDAQRDGLALVARGGRDDPARTDRGDPRAQLSAGGPRHITQLRAGGFRRNLGLDLVP